MKIELNTDFMTEEIVDCLVKDYAAIEATKKQRPEVNVDRAYQVVYTYYLIKSISEECENAKISYRLFDPFDTSGSVSIEADEIEFDNPELFSKAVALAGTFDVYTKTNGKIQMDFGFDGLVKA